MPITLDSRKITSKVQVDALKDAGVITAAQAKELLRGLKPAANDKPAPAAASAAQIAVAPRGDKIPKGFIELDRSLVDSSFLAPNKAEASSRTHAFSKIMSSVSDLYYYVPADDKEVPAQHRALLSAVKDVAAGATNFMAKQQSLIEADHYSFPAQIWSPGNTGFHPRELEARLEKALKPFGVTLKTLPDALRAAAMDIHSNEQATHNPQLRLLNAANAFENRGNSAAYQAALEYPSVFRVNGREGSWQLKLTPANDGMQQIEIVLRPGTKAPAATEKSPAWMNGKLDALDYSGWNPSLPARFTATPASVPTAATTTTAAVTPQVSSSSNDRALSLARSLEHTTDVNSVPRNISLADIQSAVSTLRAGALDVAARVQGTRGNSVGFGGETVSAATLTALADHLELLASRMGGAPTTGTKIAADKAVSISAAVASATTANEVPRNLSRADLENAAFTLRAGAVDVKAAVAGTRGSQTTWGGQLTSASALLSRADHCTELALLMKQAGY